MRIFLASALVFIWAAGLASAAPVCDGVADDTAEVTAAAISGVPLPAGDCRVTGPVSVVATVPGVHNNPGMRLCGAGLLKTRIVADYNGDEANAGVVNITANGVGKYTVGSQICDLMIVQKPGRTGLNGIQLTAGWFVEIERVKVTGMSGSGIKVPLRADLHPTISDGYQNFSLMVRQSSFDDNMKWGIDFGAGQSPGSYSVSYSIIANNGGGLRITAGQGEIVGNLIVGNGRYGEYGGMLIDTVEGPTMVMKVERNEFDTNYNWHMNILRSRGMELRQNRFISQTYNAAQGGVVTPGGAHMRPWVHVSMGAGPANEVVGLLAVRNLHRTVTVGATTTASAIAYTASGGSFYPLNPNRFERNSFGPMPADGVTQNSLNFSKYLGMGGTGAEIIDP